MMEQAVWCPANREYFRGGGYSVHYVTRGGAPVTMMRLNIVKGLGPVSSWRKAGLLICLPRCTRPWTNALTRAGRPPGSPRA